MYCYLIFILYLTGLVWTGFWVQFFAFWGSSECQLSKCVNNYIACKLFSKCVNNNFACKVCSKCINNYFACLLFSKCANNYFGCILCSKCVKKYIVCILCSKCVNNYIACVLHFLKHFRDDIWYRVGFFGGRGACHPQDLWCMETNWFSDDLFGKSFTRKNPACIMLVGATYLILV